MNNEGLSRIAEDVIKKEFSSLDCRVLHDAKERSNIDNEAASTVIRITESGNRFYFCLVVPEEYREDTPSSRLEINVRSFIKNVISKFDPKHYSAPQDGWACELWVLTAHGIKRK